MVEWKKLGELCCIRTGKLNANAQVQNGQYPFFTCDAKPFTIDKYAFDTEAIMISGNGSQVGHINYYKGKFNAYQRTYVIDRFNDINVFYLLHYLKGTMRSYVMEKSKKGSVPYITLPMLENFCLPIPSLSEQERIVGILDTFTASIDNLKGQIAQRRKQFEFYRDQLLDLEGKEGVEMKTIEGICKRICSGGTPSTTHKEYYEGNIPWLRTQEVDWKDILDTDIKISEEAVKHSSAKLIPINCVIVAMYGATAAKSAINKIELTTNQACCNLEIDNDKALYKFVFHWLCKEYLNLKSMGEGSQNNINGKK